MKVSIEDPLIIRDHHKLYYSKFADVEMTVFLIYILSGYNEAPNIQTFNLLISKKR